MCGCEGPSTICDQAVKQAGKIKVGCEETGDAKSDKKQLSDELKRITRSRSIHIKPDFLWCNSS